MILTQPSPRYFPGATLIYTGTRFLEFRGQKCEIKRSWAELRGDFTGAPEMMAVAEVLFLDAEGMPTALLMVPERELWQVFDGRGEI